MVNMDGFLQFHAQVYIERQHGPNVNVEHVQHVDYCRERRVPALMVPALLCHSMLALKLLLICAKTGDQKNYIFYLI